MNIDTLVEENAMIRQQIRAMTEALAVLREHLSLLRYQAGLRNSATYVIGEIERITARPAPAPEPDNSLVKAVDAARNSLNEAKQIEQELIAWIG